jgi:hypothetical protein
MSLPTVACAFSGIPDAREALWMLVLKKYGQSTVTPMPNSASSPLKVSLSEMTPDLVTL